VIIEELNWSYSISKQILPYSPLSSLLPPDIIFAVDCIFNPSLVRPLIETIDSLASIKTLVVIVSELRSEEVMREFLETWLGLNDRRQVQEIWKVHRVSNEILDESIGNGKYVIWLGWKECKN